jgi:hypothetical protein
MTTDKLDDIRKAIADSKRCGATWFKLHVEDAAELASSVWPQRPGIKWRARVQAPTREIEA